MEQRPRVDFDFDLWSSIEYQHWYIDNEGSYLFGSQLMVVPPHIHQRGHQKCQQGHPQSLNFNDPIHTLSNSYHPDLEVDNYLLELSGYAYHSEILDSTFDH
ncbi:hypothetical protein GOBAR_DD08612 [Gossypium barbadense]|nr:hypothetical protein GOBAR_DD08612 [Gossypium barbadense]